MSEAALRAVAIVALCLILWRWMRPTPADAARPDVVAAQASALGSQLQRWTDAPVAAGHVALDGAPNAEGRAWLRALARAGMRIGWSAERAAPMAIAGEPVVDPAGGVRVDVAGADSTRIAVGDALSASDTARITRTGATVMLPAAADTLVAREGGTTARAAVPASPALRDVIVVGRAGWEAKFVAAALEERGWHVPVRLSVAPGIAVTAAGAGAVRRMTFDTARVAAVVVLDSAALDATEQSALVRYVRSGGGVVLAGDAAESATLRALAPGSIGASIVGTPGALDGATPKRGLTLAPIEGMRADAVVLERREGDRAPSAPVAVAARRAGAGRVAQIGYAETWRWRMGASDDAPTAHRAWWARVVGAVAYAPMVTATASDPLGAGADPAPYASTIDALGAPTAAPPVRRASAPRGAPWPSDGVLAALAGIAVLGEVASRRLRGAR